MLAQLLQLGPELLARRCRSSFRRPTTRSPSGGRPGRRCGWTSATCRSAGSTSTRSRRTSAARCCGRSWSPATTSGCTSATAPLAAFVDTLPLLHPYGKLHSPRPVRHRRRGVPDGFQGPGKYDGSVVNWVNGPLLAHIGRRDGLRRAVRAVRAPDRHQHRDDDRAGPGLTAWDRVPLPLLPTTVVGSYSVPGLARAAQDRLLPRAAVRHPAGRRSTRWRSRPRSRTRRSPASTSSPTASCAATTTSTTSWPASPASRSTGRQGVLLRLLRRRRRSPRCRWTSRATVGLVDDFEFTRRADRPAAQVLLHRPVLAVPAAARPALRQPARPGAGARPRAATARPPGWPRPAPR